jgi:hypothetical protein
MTIARDLVCDHCHRHFVQDGHARVARFCSKTCRRRFGRAVERAQLVGMAWKATVREEERGGAGG